MIASSPSLCRWIKPRLLALLAASVALSAAATPATDATRERDDLRWLARVTYGADSATLAHLRNVGRERFLDEQLAARDDTLPAPVQAQIDAMPITQTPAATLLADEIAAQQRVRALKDGDAASAARRARNEAGNAYARDAMRRHLLRAVYSPAQLKEQMDWFWLNHFSVFARKGALRWLVADYDEHAIRPHALGKFRDLVLATLTHPAMLQYLDNARNARDHVNENYARELMELHTLGVDAGYTQRDVQELARVLTGVGVALGDRGARQPGYRSDGLYAFYPARHDFGDKALLGQTIKGRGFDEIAQAVDLLVRQPACARFVSRKLAQYFVADEPPAALVTAMSDTFRRSDGDIAQVLRTLFASREFAVSLGSSRFKDPMHYVVSSVRLACDRGTIADERPLLGWLNGQDEALFGRQSPDGYALAASAWTSSGQLSRRFEIARAIGGNYANVLACGDASGETPRLDGALYAASIQPYLSPATRDALAQARSPREWNAMLLASPEWNLR